MAFIAPVIGIVGGIISAVGTIAAGVAQKNALDYQAQVANNNAIIAAQNAQYTIEAGQSKAATESLKQAEIGGEIKAAQAANGIDVNTGSNKAVQISQRELGNLSTKQTLANAQLQQYGYLSQQTNFQAQSKLDTYEGSQALTGAELGAAGTALGTAAKWLAPPVSSGGGGGGFGY